MERAAKSRGIELKSADEIATMRESGRRLAAVREALASRVRPGVTTRQLDRVARRLIEEQGGVPSFLGYNGFPGALCTSINEQIVHGIPSDRVLLEGDIVSVDMGLVWNGFHSDTAITFPVGEIDDRSARLIRVAEEALAIAIPLLEPGRRMGDMGAAVQRHVESHGFSVVREYAGHGIGRNLHEDPRVPNWGKAGSGMRWKAGMVVAIEPMINAGRPGTKELKDGWTVVAADGSRSAHAEHTIAITEDGPVVLTAP